VPKISFADRSNASAQGLYLQKGVWGTAKDDDVLTVFQSVLDAYNDLYGIEHMRKAPHTLIQNTPSGSSFIKADLSFIILNATDEDWATYARSFSHELYHYTANISAKNGRDVV
jgi:hypothetical protein